MLLGHIKSYFEHNRTERNGSITILVILGLVCAGSELAFYFQKPPEYNGAPFEIYFAKNDSSLASKDSKDELNVSDSLFSFNPNELSDSGFVALGFSEKDISTLRKYQSAGGKFRSKSDFSKMYFLNAQEYDSLKPHILLPDARPAYQDSNRVSKKRTGGVKWSDTASTSYYTYKNIICDLNLADTNELKALPYIGSFYANRICEYREELGGFHTIAQLLELWKMTPETIDKFADRVSIDLSAIEQLNVNEATAQELSKHPYISAHLASQIVIEREANGAFESLGNNCLEGLLNEELCIKLAPYLAFE